MFYHKRRTNEPPSPIIVQLTSDLCIFETLVFKLSPPIFLCFSVVTCAASRGRTRCLFVLLTVWGLLNGLSYQCLTFVLVFYPQKNILFLFCGPVYAAGRVIKCAAEILSQGFACERGNSDVQSEFVLKKFPSSRMKMTFCHADQC